MPLVSSRSCLDMMSGMETSDIKALIAWLQERVSLEEGDEITISFAEPNGDEFAEKGFDDEAVSRTLGSDWWCEMVTDIVETPEYAEPGESAEQILSYAKDVVSEYVRKRLYT